MNADQRQYSQSREVTYRRNAMTAYTEARYLDASRWSSLAEYERDRAASTRRVGPCPCECNRGGFCGGCGHAGCGGRR